jgi:hypothetical protein
MHFERIDSKSVFEMLRSNFSFDLYNMGSAWLARRCNEGHEGMRCIQGKSIDEMALVGRKNNELV